MMLSPTTGSIGAGPISYDPANNRIKGFAQFKINTFDDLMRLKAQIKQLEAANPQSDRTTVRALIHKSLVETIRGHPNGYGSVEAVVNIDNVTPDYNLVYLGRNMESRRSEPEVKVEEVRNVEAILSTVVPTTPQVARARLEQGGYRLERQEGSLPSEVVNQLVDLYHEAYSHYTFEITPQSVAAFVREGNVVLIGYAADGSVASAMVAERAQVEIEGTALNLYELSEYATFRSHRGAGLMTAMQMEAIHAIRSMEDGYSAVIYSENRAAWSPVTISSFKTGHASYCGTLDKHCALVADRNFAELGVFENLHVISYNGYSHGSD